MSTARRCLKSPRSLSSTSAHPTMVTLVNVMVMNGWFTSFSFNVNWLPHSWDTAISDSDLETPRSRSWVWSKGKVIQSSQYINNSWNRAISKFDLETSKAKVMSEWGQTWRSHIILSIQPMHFLFVSHQLDQPFLIYGQNSVWSWKNTSEIFKENLPK